MEELSLGNISWPFSQGNFDRFVQNINSNSSMGSEKMNKLNMLQLNTGGLKRLIPLEMIL